MTALPRSPWITAALLSATTSALISPAIAATPVAPATTLAGCIGIADATKRLACYDALANAPVVPSTAAAAAQADPEKPLARTVMPAPPVQSGAADGPAGTVAKPPSSFLARRWETEGAEKHGVFAFRPHQDNYVLFAKYSTDPNGAPFSPQREATQSRSGLQRTEAAFQLSFKTKVIEDVSPQHADLWFGYTQQSYWQAYNQRASSPFRETNYQPEIMAVIPLHLSLLGVEAHFINFGLVHQSNGQSATLSRSWNRAYAQLGLERGDYTLTARVWKRFNESADKDNNPDIIDYMGRGDIAAAYRANGQKITLMARHNFSTGRSAAQLAWAVPVAGDLKAYAQLFSGYGQSLIDYNAYQRTIGLGVMLDY
jgi:phospholipase A1